MDEFLADVEGLSPGERVTLYVIDLNPIGINVIFRWTPMRQDGGSLWWRGDEYPSRPIIASGFKKSAQDKPAEPTLTVSNIDQGGYAILKQYGELLNARMYKWVTFLRYLDKDLNGDVNPTADGSAIFMPEIWIIEQKVGADSTMVQWRLRSPLDIREKKLPNRRAYRDVCQRVYRYWDADAGVFKYASEKACPYTSATDFFKRDGTATLDPALDECTMDMGGCQLRYPAEDLPGWFFPGLRRFG